MHESTLVAGWLAGIIGFIAYVPYFFAIIYGKTSPNRATWFIWTMVNTISFLSYSVSGAGNAIWFSVSDAVASLVILIFSIRRGEGGWNGLDQVCLLTASLSVFFWWLSGSALVGLSMSLIADAMGAIPTITKTYHRPESENRLSWTMTTIATVINLFAIENWRELSSLLYPIYMLLLMTIITAFLWSRTKRNDTLIVL